MIGRAHALARNRLVLPRLASSPLSLRFLPALLTALNQQLASVKDMFDVAQFSSIVTAFVAGDSTVSYFDLALSQTLPLLDPAPPREEEDLKD